MSGRAALVLRDERRVALLRRVRDGHTYFDVPGGDIRADEQPADTAVREYQAANPDGSDELRTPYLVDDSLDLAAWARDAVALALPEKILCREDCAGLCPTCGKNLNDEPHTHDEAPADSRWAALESLREQL